MIFNLYFIQIFMLSMCRYSLCHFWILFFCTNYYLYFSAATNRKVPVIANEDLRFFVGPVLNRTTDTCFSLPCLLKHIKTNILEVRRTYAEAIAFLLPDLSHAEIFGIRVQNGKAMRLLTHQAVKARCFSFEALRLAAWGVLCHRDWRGEYRRQQHEPTPHRHCVPSPAPS